MEVKPPSFSDTLQKVQSVQMATTSPMHIKGAGAASADAGQVAW